MSDLAGDRVWFADFSDLRTPGTYHLYDPINKVRSFSFRIADDVYRPVLRDAVRVFYYQRSGTPITEQHGGVWHHPGGHLGNHPGPRRAVHTGRKDAGAAAQPALAAGSTRATSTSMCPTWRPRCLTSSGLTS